MGSAKIPRHEAIISICLIAILCGVAVAVILPQFGERQDSVGGLEEAIAGLKPKGFTALTGLEIYNPDNLYEKIDGRAPLYTESGFEKLFTRLYKNDSNEAISFEVYIYDMARPENALAVYSQQKREDAENLIDVDSGYRTSNALFYSLGRYYIELVGSAESAELLEAMAELAGQIKDALPAQDSVKAEEMQILQKAGTQAGSIKFSTDNTFGCKELTGIFSAVIKIDGKAVTIFLGKRTDEKEAASLVDIYSKFLKDLGATESATRTADKSAAGRLPVESARCFDFSGPVEVVFDNGRFLAGVHEAADAETAAKAAKILNDVLNEVQKK
jgi:hypothetical protein